MALTFGQGKVIVARTIGGSFDLDQLNAAGDAILMAIQEWNLRQKWNFLLIDNSLDPIDIVSGENTYALPTGLREAYDARLIVSNKRTLKLVPQSDVDRVVRNVEDTGIPVLYNMFRGSDDFVASNPSSQAGQIRLWPTPNYSQENDLYVKYFRVITEPTLDADILDVPDRYVRAMLTMAKYYYLVDKDAESARTEHHRVMSEQLFRWAERDDQEYHDEDIRLVPQMEYGDAWGPDWDVWWP